MVKLIRNIIIILFWQFLVIGAISAGVYMALVILKDIDTLPEVIALDLTIIGVFIVGRKSKEWIK